MTLEEIKNILTGIPGYADKVTFYMWPEGQAPALPFICYWQPGADNFAADGIVYHSAPQIDVELYSRLRAPDEEAKVEAALTAAGIFWEKQVEYIDSEQVYMTTYSMEV